MKSKIMFLEENIGEYLHEVGIKKVSQVKENNNREKWVNLTTSKLTTSHLLLKKINR